jgi:hypothetical protein
LSVAAQEQTAPATSHRKGKERLRLIEAGELVSNAPLRERCEWLVEHDPSFSFAIVCARMEDHGFPQFARSTKSRAAGDTTYLLRVLGMRDRAASNKNGRRYESPNRTAWIPYDLAVALARSLGMDPVDAGV